jgi:uncharacterized membrane protein SirB2
LYRLGNFEGILIFNIIIPSKVLHEKNNMARKFHYFKSCFCFLYNIWLISKTGFWWLVQISWMSGSSHLDWEISHLRCFSSNIFNTKQVDNLWTYEKPTRFHNGNNFYKIKYVLLVFERTARVTWIKSMAFVSYLHQSLNTVSIHTCILSFFFKYNSHLHKQRKYINIIISYIIDMSGIKTLN